MGHPAGVSMASFDGAALASALANEAGTWMGATVPGLALAGQGGTDPGIPRGGSAALAAVAVALAGRLDGLGPPIAAQTPTQASTAAVARLDATGALLVGRFIAVSAVYRTGDRLTLAGYALNLAGQPLREYQVQFIGESVQAHYFGAGTDLDGVYVAFLDQGDTYTAFAYSPTTGITFRLESMQTTPNQTTLTFRQVTKRGGSGEGLFRQWG
jgi:hypothetical protein